MKLAFCIFKYFPYGGLQRDMYRAAEVAIARGHSVDIYTMDWEGLYIPNANINIIKVHCWTNHGRAISFITKLKKILNNRAYDRVIGFNKIPGLDIYFTGENCFAKHVERKRLPLIHYFPRYFFFSLLEKKLFDEKSESEILLISPREKKVYQKFYHTQDARFHLLFPGIEKPSCDNQAAINMRNSMRKLHNINENKVWLLFVASDYALKGLWRILELIRSLDKTHADQIILSVVGHDSACAYQSFLSRNNIKTRVDFLGASDEVYALMAGADLLMHPAKVELAGKVILEALVNHLPVLTTEICGCAHYVIESHGGVVLPEPFSQQVFMHAFLQIMTPGYLQGYRKNLSEYSINEGVYRSQQHIVDCIENIDVHCVREFYLDKFLINFLPQDKKKCIAYVFSLQGEIYRQVEKRKTILVDIGGNNYFIKMHYGVGWAEIIKNLLVFKSVALGAQPEYAAIREMQKAGILVPKISAYATDGINPAKINSFIMTERIYYQYDLEKLCQTWPQRPPNFLFKRRLIHRVAEIARKMHVQGMNHRDFYLCHLLLNQKSELNFDLYLIDLHRVQIRKKTPLRWIVKDLAGLYFSAMDIGLTHHDIYYFLTQYYQQPLRYVFKKKRLVCFWVYLRAKMLHRRHKNRLSL